MAPDDLKGLCAWLKCDPARLEIRKDKMAIEVFQAHIESCLASYPSFPKEAQRTQRILRRLQKGEPAYPVFVKEGDEAMFILEGRHRIVALYQQGVRSVEVGFVSAKPEPEPKKRPSPGM